MSNEYIILYKYVIIYISSDLCIIGIFSIMGCPLSLFQYILLLTGTPLRFHTLTDVGIHHILFIDEQCQVDYKGSITCCFVIRTDDRSTDTKKHKNPGILLSIYRIVWKRDYDHISRYIRMSIVIRILHLEQILISYQKRTTLINNEQCNIMEQLYFFGQMINLDYKISNINFIKFHDRRVCFNYKQINLCVKKIIYINNIDLHRKFKTFMYY